ncbi:sphingosine N-acyltransferase lag1 [Histoplasma capsulatum G186AR]|uniref:Sphingosine N-acyltransferase lag1 n=2 Tax=Ajellomyces capsulatus TaxID=5037 RepID=C0NII6_AJECG|nr:sphingosine N-acyltransferase lag1 [Histoplasma capsulatum G186AR]EEH08706.1 sphingosine N-acyltransferase lag1 [Histoplasma capsulatum G186AR]KAG5303983.1 sphingosine N-acyltransferase lag1 [Histoplasma capsulatum]QSS69582.1 sphingosine N-acyltransferase lag1 [Histoplasma capsulatum G186AR]
MARAYSSQPNSVSEVNACVSTIEGRRMTKVKPTPETNFRQWVLQNQIGICVTILTMIFALHNLYPSLRPYTSPFLQLPHYQPEKGTYVQGWDDIYFVMGGVLAFTAVRAIAIEWIFQPLARRYGLKHKASVRLAEQGWILVYYFGFWAYGVFLWYNSKYWYNFREIWTDWPSRDISGIFKWYCLTQLAFWFQQILVINIEERRKDYCQMLVHHIVTSTLLGSAYVYGFYNVANVVLCIMDIVDFLLPAAKILKYLGYERACTAGFIVFLVTWVISRHIVYNLLWWSIYINVPDVMPYGCYSATTAEMISPAANATLDGAASIDLNNWSHLLQPFRDLGGRICMSPRVKWVFLSFLLFLQILAILWFTMILRVAVKVLKSGSAEDSRSDDEEEDEEEVDSQNLRTEGNAGVRDGGRGNGTAIVSGSSVSSSAGQGHHPVRIRTGRGRVTLSDQNDRKALLGRIGCDKPT